MSDPITRTGATYLVDTARAAALELLDQAKESGRMAYGPTFDRSLREHCHVLSTTLLWADRSPSCTSTARSLAYAAAVVDALLHLDRSTFTHADVAAVAAAYRESWGLVD